MQDTVLCSPEKYGFDIFTADSALPFANWWWPGDEVLCIIHATRSREVRKFVTHEYFI